MPFTMSDGVFIEIKSVVSGEPRFYDAERAIYKNWYPEEDNDRLALITELIADAGETDVELKQYYRELSHARYLNLTLKNGVKISIRFDQGMCYWNSVERYLTYPFDESLEDQLEWINEEGNKKRIKNSSLFDTNIFVKIIK